MAAGFRLPEPKVDRTPRPQLRVCPKTVTSAPFPEIVTAPVQYGARICVYLLNYHFLPEDRLAQLLSDLFGLRLVPATFARMSAACGKGAKIQFRYESGANPEPSVRIARTRPGRESEPPGSLLERADLVCYSGSRDVAFSPFPRQTLMARVCLVS
jgi:hypothetical protein